MILSQMLKGTLEGCVLAVLSTKKRYGYEISQTLMEYGFGRIPEGTIYPLLLRPEKRGAITASLCASPQGPQRKYYALTELGKKELAEFFYHYRKLALAVDQLAKATGGYLDAQENEAAFGAE